MEKMKRVQIEGKFAIAQLSMGTKICRPAGTSFMRGQFLAIEKNCYLVQGDSQKCKS